MKVLNIHDYHESNDNIAYKALQECGFEIINPKFDYDGMDPRPLFDLVVAHFQRNFCDIVVGTGIGAFLAMLLSAKELVPCVLVNPIVVPGLYLDELGYNRCVGISGLRDLEFMYMQKLNLCGVSTIVDVNNRLMDARMLNYTKILLHNPRYYEISNSTAPFIIDMFKTHVKEWFYDTYERDLA